MNKIFIAFCISILTISANAQTFFVSGIDKDTRMHIEAKVKSEGYTLVDSASADYVVHLVIYGPDHAVSFGYRQHGYILLSDRESGEEISRTPEKAFSSTLYYPANESYIIFNKLSKKYLSDELKKCPHKQSLVQ